MSHESASPEQQQVEWRLAPANSKYKTPSAPAPQPPSGPFYRRISKRRSFVYGFGRALKADQQASSRWQFIEPHILCIFTSGALCLGAFCLLFYIAWPRIVDDAVDPTPTTRSSGCIMQRKQFFFLVSRPRRVQWIAGIFTRIPSLFRRKRKTTPLQKCKGPGADSDDRALFRVLSRPAWMTWLT